jgi:hypothetical protein
MQAFMTSRTIKTREGMESWTRGKKEEGNLPMKNRMAIMLLNPLLEANTIVRALQITSIVGI